MFGQPLKIGGTAVLICGWMLGQGEVNRPGFEVASVKPAGPQDRVIGMFTWPGGRITVTLYTLKMLIHEAYGVQAFQISGGPRWMDEDKFDVEARPPASYSAGALVTANPKLPPPPEELLMLQSLLADRFQLKVHRESKEGAILALVVAEKGSRLTPAKSVDDFPVVSYGRTGKTEAPDFMRGQNASMERFAARVALDLGRPVVDRTGLKGFFDFGFEYARDVADGDSLSQAIKDQLGLKLVSARGTLETLVVDRAERLAGN
jgi:uncharacterized protein (TIGR03435 family)